MILEFEIKDSILILVESAPHFEIFKPPTKKK